jgi:hypothetical protein
MRISLPALVMAGLLAAAPDVFAATTTITREAQTDVMLTVYNGNLGLVKDVREVRLPVGLGEVPFMDVAAMIDPTTVHLRSLSDPAGLTILEQSYEYDLLSSDKLLEKYVGKTVRLYQSDGTFHEARLLSTAGPVFEINGQIHLGYTGRMVLPALPENLVAKPTLVWLLRNRTAAAQKVEASYLTGGVGWKADYVLVVDAGDTRGDLTGWVTIDNKSGATYANAALKLVAGDVNRARDGRREGRLLELAAKAASVRDASHDFAEEGFFEYHLYTLDGRTTLKDQQTKQLALLNAADVAVVKRLEFRGAPDYYRTTYGAPIANRKVTVLLELDNRAANGLGRPLPRGKVRVYKADAGGSQQFIGEDWIDHTPADERVKIALGEAFDVVGERTQKEWRKLGPGLWEVEWEIALRNHTAQAQTVTVIEPVPGDWQVLQATHAWDKPEAHTLRFSIPVPTAGAARLVYRVRIRG